ncbi:MAG: hypothetical protein QGI45_09120, partial [Myxococcota bacterium]|nr:hypothetical protein [Myxococcota bacterium]
MPFRKNKSSKKPLLGVLVLAMLGTFLTFGTPDGGCGAEFSDVELATSYENQAQALECYEAQTGKYSCDFYPHAPLGALAVQTSIHFHPALKFKTMRCDTEEACTKIAGSHDVSMHATNTQVNFVVFSLNNDVLPNDLSF